MGQDYKGGGWNHDRNKKFGGKWGTNKAFAAQDEWEDVENWGDDITKMMTTPMRPVKR